MCRWKTPIGLLTGVAKYAQRESHYFSRAAPPETLVGLLHPAPATQFRRGQPIGRSGVDAS
ncbi:hypothetical protein PCAR4_1140020 [Paraburkholderia caribensis]|nr:hypothetical protein PCAR4_1140020 [Paraburkholderia caribensis]